MRSDGDADRHLADLSWMSLNILNNILNDLPQLWLTARWHALRRIERGVNAWLEQFCARDLPRPWLRKPRERLMPQTSQFVDEASCSCRTSTQHAPNPNGEELALL